MIPSRYALLAALLPALHCATTGHLLAQGLSCNTATPISGPGEWPFSIGQQFERGILGCNLDDNARFWRWSATSVGNYKAYTVGERGVTSLAISTADNCTAPWLEVIGCSFDSDFPIYLPSAVPNDPYLFQITTYSGPVPRTLVVEPMLCGPGFYTEDNLEDNDTLQTAVVLPEGLHPDLAVRWDDPDYYQVLIPAGEELLVRALESDPDVRVTIYNDLGQPMDTRVERDIVRFAPGTGAPHRATIGVEIEAPPGMENCSAYDLFMITHAVPQPQVEFCDPALSNSTGSPTQLTLFAPPFEPIPGSLLQAYADNGPPGAFGFLIAGSQVQSIGQPMMGPIICIGGAVLRYNIPGTPWNSLGQFDASGRWSSFVNECQGFNGIGSAQIYIPSAYKLPNELPNNLGPITTGQSWGFQLWHRDGNGTSAASNGILLNF